MRKPRVLIVDDNRITTKLLSRYLEATGYETFVAFNGFDCLKHVQEYQPDAIILDVMMPRMDGYETAKKLKSNVETKNIPIVITTALNDVSNQLKAIESGADDYLSKPIEEKLLMAKVKVLTDLHIMKLKLNDIEAIIKQINDENYGNEFMISQIKDLLI